MESRRSRGAAVARLLPLALLACLASVDPVPSWAGEPEDGISVARSLELASDTRPAIVRIQWRRTKAPQDVVERHAVVVDSEGWLLMAGPRPSPNGTLAARFEDGHTVRAEIWASDSLTCLTLLRVPIRRLPPLAVRSAALGPGEAPAEAGTLGPAPVGTAAVEEQGDVAAARPTAALTPPRLAPGFPFVMVTAEGDVAQGRIRANHRRRVVEDPMRERTVEVTCLDKAALSVLSPDLGAPWLDSEGRLVGLLVGADVGPAIQGAPDRLRPVVTAAYAVPSDVIRIVWPLLKLKRRVTRVALGARVRPLSRATRHHVCPDCEGYEILALAPGSSAARAELEPQDIIHAVNGVPLAPRADLWDVLLPYRPGDQVRLGLLRRGEHLQVDVVLGRAAD